MIDLMFRFGSIVIVVLPLPALLNVAVSALVMMLVDPGAGFTDQFVVEFQFPSVVISRSRWSFGGTRLQSRANAAAAHPSNPSF